MASNDHLRQIALALSIFVLTGCSTYENDSVAQSTDQKKQAASATESTPSSAGENKQNSNRLARETSPYLLLHAHNPVDWYPWGPEAFEKAKREGKPIFLSVGYSSCYWCHVMERESFTDPEIARFMNENFVNIKVDREERPDVDDIYMTALHVYLQMSGSGGGGGWPMSMFLTPQGKPIAGGTYFPPNDIDGRIGFSTVMKRIAEIWKNNRDDVERNAELITANVRRTMKPKLSLTPAKLDRQLVANVSQALMDSYDSEFGGVDFNPARPDAPKFPVPAKLALLQYASQQGDKQAAGILEKTLDRIALGGIRDHLGGGFHRYSTDRFWLVPHFEKMLYDNAQLADVYLKAWQQTGKPLYRETAEEIFSFIARDMTDPDGAFYSALDAETDTIEGKYYVWPKEEIEQILGPQDAELFKEVYGINSPQDFEHGYILFLPTVIDDIAIERQISADELKQQLSAMRRKLFEARQKRKSPLRDDKVLTSWNGLMIRALANGGEILERQEYIEKAAKAALFILSNMRDEEGRLLRTYRAKTAKLNAYLDDYAFLIEGLLALHNTTHDDKWLNAARRLTDEQIRLFRDDTGHGFFFTSHHHEELLARTKNAYDSVIPSGNSVSARNLIRLAKLTGEEKYRQQAQEILELFAPQLENTPRAMTNMSLALAEFLEDQRTVAPQKKTSAAPKKTSRKEQIIPIAATVLQKSDSKSKKKKKPEYVKASVYLSVDKLPAGKTCRVVLLIDVQPGWHINANPPQPDFVIPTSFAVKSKLGTKLTGLKYPKGHKYEVRGFDEPLSVYEKRIAIYGTLKVPATAAGKAEDLDLRIRYQACNDARCLRPMNISLGGKIPVAGQGEVVKSINQKLFPPVKPRPR